MDQRFTHDHAYIFQNPDGRIIFAIPYEGRFTLIGTTDVELPEHEAPPPARAKIEAGRGRLPVRAASRYLASPVTPADVLWTYAGVRPLLDEGGSASSVTRDYLLEADASAGAPLLNVWGGKLTTYRKLAEDGATQLGAHCWATPASPTAGPGRMADIAAFTAELPGGDVARLGATAAWPPGVDIAPGLQSELRAAWAPPRAAQRWAHYTACNKRPSLAKTPEAAARQPTWAPGRPKESMLRRCGQRRSPGLSEVAPKGLFESAELGAAPARRAGGPGWHAGVGELATSTSADDVLWRQRSKLGLHYTAEQREAVAAPVAVGALDLAGAGVYRGRVVGLQGAAAVSGAGEACEQECSGAAHGAHKHSGQA